MQVPIVLGVRGQAEALVQQAGAGLCIEPENVSQLIQVLQRLADNPDEARRMGAAGRDFVAAHYDRNVLAAQYLELICGIVAEKRGEATTPNGDQVTSQGPPTPTRS